MDLLGEILEVLVDLFFWSVEALDIPRFSGCVLGSLFLAWFPAMLVPDRHWGFTVAGLLVTAGFLGGLIWEIRSR